MEDVRRADMGDTITGTSLRIRHRAARDARGVNYISLLLATQHRLHRLATHVLASLGVLLSMEEGRHAWDTLLRLRRTETARRQERVANASRFTGWFWKRGIVPTWMSWREATALFQIVGSLWLWITVLVPLYGVAWMGVLVSWGWMTLGYAVGYGPLIWMEHVEAALEEVFMYDSSVSEQSECG